MGRDWPLIPTIQLLTGEPAKTRRTWATLYGFRLGGDLTIFE
jgi:hypothetical protein